MKRKHKWAITIFLACGFLLLLALNLGVKKIEKEANISIATSNLRDLVITWREFRKAHEGRPPQSIDELIQWDDNLATRIAYEGTPTFRSEEFPEIVYNQSSPLEDLDPSTVIMTQKWSDDVYLIALADGQILRVKSVEQDGGINSVRSAHSVDTP